MTEHEAEAGHMSGGEFTEQERQLIRATIASPRLNERYSYFGRHFTRWRLMQATVLLFTIVVAYGFWLVAENDDEIQEQRSEAREQICGAVQEGFNGVIELVDTITERPADAPPPTPEQQARVDELRRQAREILVATESCQLNGGNHPDGG